MIKKFLTQFIKRTVWSVLKQNEKIQPENFLVMYRLGYYPVAAGWFKFITWKNPERRAIIPLDERFQVGKRLAKKVQSGYFDVTFDRAFRQVVEGCAELNSKRTSTWISPELIESYTRLHQLGYAHSVEVWRNGQLVGGEFGTAIGGFYAGESIFTREDYASRVAIFYLVKKLRDSNFSLLDTQELSGLAQEFGAYEISNPEYKSLLECAISKNVKF